LVPLLREAALPKVPGLSAKRLQMLVEDCKKEIVEHSTNDYYGKARWAAEWIVEETREVPTRSGLGHQVLRARFEEAWGETDDPIQWEIPYKFKIKPAVLAAALPVITKAVSGTWTAGAWFGWKPGYFTTSDELKVGDLMESTSDEFRHGAESAQGEHWAEVIKVQTKFKVRARARKDGSISMSVKYST
jgi:hypothetical protein